jgi:predicted DsbA family dithiol-disulfide isomerase
MSEADEVLTIDVVSDVVCPWCYLGEKRLEEALSEDAGPVVVRWRPYQLDPTIPEGGLDRTEYMEKKFGKSDKIKRSPNTLDAHRIIRWAAAAGVQAEVADRLFKAYFVEGHDIGDRGVLTAIASECGLDAGEVEKRLADDADIDLVRQEIEQAQSMGVSGVPFFIFGGRIGVPGAQEPSVLRQAIAQARQEMGEGANATARSA